MNAPPGMVVDHINGDIGDNRKANLRIVPHAHNIQNRTRLSKANTSGYRGVRWKSDSRKWVGESQVDGVRTYLGSFASAKDAWAAVRDFLIINSPGYIDHDRIG